MLGGCTSGLSWILQAAYEIFGSEGEQVCLQIVELLGGKVGCFAVTIERVSADKDLANGGCGAIVQIGSSAPEFHQGWGVERSGILRAIVTPACADILGGQIRE